MNYVLLFLIYVEMPQILADILTGSRQKHVIFVNSDNFLLENLSVSASWPLWLLISTKPQFYVVELLFYQLLPTDGEMERIIIS